MDGEVLATSSFERPHILDILRIAFQRLGDTIPLDEPLHCYVSGFNSSIARSRRPSTGSSDHVASSLSRQSRWTSSMNGGVERCWASIPLILNSSSPLSFSEVLRQCVNVALALRDERNSVVVGFVFESNLDAFRDPVASVSMSSRSSSSTSGSGVTQMESTMPWTTRQPPASSRCFAVSRIS